MAESNLVVKLNAQDNVSGALKNVKNNLQQTAKSGARLDEIKDKFARITNSTAPLQKKLKQLQNEIAQMNIDGLNKTDIFIQMTEKAGEYRDAISDARNAVNQFANDNFKLQAAAEGLQLITGVASMATGALGMLGIENEKVEQAMLKVQSAIALCNGAQSIANLLNKDSALSLRLKSIMTAASTAATAKNTVAEGTNAAAIGIGTLARKAWNVAVAIGKALMGDFSGLLLVGAAALATWAICTDDATEKQEKENKAVDEAAEAHKKYADDVATGTAQLIGKYQILRSEWKNLKTEGEKTEWIKENQNEFSNLGLSIYDVTDAENVFVNNTGAVQKAFSLRAQAIASQNMLIDAYTRYYKKMNDIDNTLAGGGYRENYKAGNEFEKMPDQLKRAMRADGAVTEGGDLYNKDDKYYTMSHGNYKLTEYGARKANEVANSDANERRSKNQSAARAELEKETAKLIKIYTDAVAGMKAAQAEVQQLDTKRTNPHARKSTGNKSSGKKEVDITQQADDYSLDYARKMAEHYESERKKMNQSDKKLLDENLKQLDRWKAEAARREAIVRVNTDTGSFEFAERMYNELVAKGEASEEALEYWFDEMQNRKLEVPIAVKLDELEHAKEMFESLDPTIKENANAIQYWSNEIAKHKIQLFDIADEKSLAYAKKQLAELMTSGTKASEEEIYNWKRLIENMQIKLNIPIPGSIEELKYKLSEAEAQLEHMNIELVSDAELADAISKIKKLEKEIENAEIKLGKKIKESLPSVQKEPDVKQFAPGSLEDKRQSLDNARTIQSRIQDDIDNKIVKPKSTAPEDISAWQEQLRILDEVNAQLEKMGLEPITVTVKTNFQEVLDEANNVFDQINTGLQTISQISGAVDAWRNMFETLSDGDDAFESFNAVLNTVMTTISALQAVLTIVNTIQALFNAGAVAGSAASTESATATAAEATAEGAGIATKTAATAANEALAASYTDVAAAAIMAAHAEIPFAGVGIAGGFTATMMTILTGVKTASKALYAFAEGGIVGGNNYHGDKVLARLNSGEMVLNKSQQANLFKALSSGNIGNSNSAMGGKVEFQISGTSLKGVLDNYNKKLARMK